MSNPSFQLSGGATWINFTATIGQAYGAHPQERIPDPTALAAWFHAVDLTPERAPTTTDVTAAHALRGALRDLALAHVEHRPTPGAALAELRRHLPAKAPKFENRGNTVALVRPADCAQALTHIALQAAMHLAGPESKQLRVCPEQDCRWVFADPTGRRRWCPSQSCANRGRVRAYRTRRKQA